MHDNHDESQQTQAVSQLDACGLFCPEPVMLLHNRIRDMASGEEAQVPIKDLV